MVAGSLSVIGGQLRRFRGVHRGGHLFALSVEFVEQCTILRDRKLPAKNATYLKRSFVLGVCFVDMREPGQDFLP